MNGDNFYMLTNYFKYIVRKLRYILYDVDDEREAAFSTYCSIIYFLKMHFNTIFVVFILLSIRDILAQQFTS